MTFDECKEFLRGHLVKNGECWEFTGFCHINGYGHIGVNHKTLQSHR